MALSIFKKSSPEVLAALREEMQVRKASKFILLFSMGSQFDHLIVQQLAKLGVYCLVADPASVKAADVKATAPAGIILSGGPASVHDEPPPFDAKIFDLDIPILGVCLGYQMWAKHIGARVAPGDKRETRQTSRRVDCARQTAQLEIYELLKTGPVCRGL